MAKSEKNSAKKSVDRRGFLKGAAAGAVGGFVAQSSTAQAQQAKTDGGPAIEVTANERCGSDFMVDVIKSLDIEYLAANPGTSFRGLHESLITYGNNTKPEFLTC